MPDKKKIILRELFHTGTVDEFVDGLNQLDDISGKLKLTYTIEKLKYEELKQIRVRLGTLINMKGGFIEDKSL